MKQRRIIVATRTFLPEGTAAAIRLGALRDALVNAGWDVRVYTTRSPMATKSTSDIRRWPVLRDKAGAVRGYIQYLSFDIPLFFRMLFSRRADLYLAEAPPTTGLITRLVSKLKRAKFVYYAADVMSAAAKGIGVNKNAVRMLEKLESGVVKHADLVLAISDIVSQKIIELGVSEERIAMIGTGIDTSTFHLQGKKIEDQGPFFIYAGTTSEIQGASIFADAFMLIKDRYPELRLIIFGQGTELAYLQSIASQSESRILLYPTVPSSEIVQWYRSALAGLASIRPGTGYDFAYATKALAMLATGLPVIYAGVGTLKEPINQYNLGKSVDWDIPAVADAMEFLIGNYDAYSSLRLQSWVAENHSMVDVAASAVLGIERIFHKT